MNADKEQSTPIFFWEGEELLLMRSLAKKRRRHVQDFAGVIKSYGKIVMDQEIELVDLQVEACLRAGELKELVTELKYINTRLDDRSQVIAALRTENQDLCDRLNGYETERW